MSDPHAWYDNNRDAMQIGPEDHDHRYERMSHEDAERAQQQQDDEQRMAWETIQSAADYASRYGLGILVLEVVKEQERRKAELRARMDEQAQQRVPF